MPISGDGEAKLLLHRHRSVDTLAGGLCVVVIKVSWNMERNGSWDTKDSSRVRRRSKTPEWSGNCNIVILWWPCSSWLLARLDDCFPVIRLLGIRNRCAFFSSAGSRNAESCSCPLGLALPSRAQGCRDVTPESATGRLLSETTRSEAIKEFEGRHSTACEGGETTRDRSPPASEVT